MRSIRGAAKRMKASGNGTATMPAMRVRPPGFTLFLDWPIMARPPMPPKKPVTVLAAPGAMQSCEAPPRWPVISPTRCSVSSDSIGPIAARISA